MTNAVLPEKGQPPTVTSPASTDLVSDNGLLFKAGDPEDLGAQLGRSTSSMNGGAFGWWDLPVGAKQQHLRASSG
jgi:hypothetical protein